MALPQVAQQYRRRFSQEHGYRFLKQDLLWTCVHVRTPAQFERWSWLVALVFNQLYLARQLGLALHRPWEQTDRPVTPQQVRRVRWDSPLPWGAHEQALRRVPGCPERGPARIRHLVGR